MKYSCVSEPGCISFREDIKGSGVFTTDLEMTLVGFIPRERRRLSESHPAHLPRPGPAVARDGASVERMSTIAMGPATRRSLVDTFVSSRPRSSPRDEFLRASTTKLRACEKM